MVTFSVFLFFFVPAEIHKRRKSLRRKFDSFSKEKKERGEFNTPNSVVKHNTISGYGLSSSSLFDQTPADPVFCYSKYYQTHNVPSVRWNSITTTDVQWLLLALTTNVLTYLKYCVYKAQVAHGRVQWVKLVFLGFCVLPALIAGCWTPSPCTLTSPVKYTYVPPSLLEVMCLK